MAPPVRNPDESRLAWYWRRGLNKLGFHLTQVSASEPGRRLDKFTHDFLGFCRWLNQARRGLACLRKDPTRRLLAIYDLTSQPFSIGDILIIQEASLVVREQQQLDQVDFALLYDPVQPTCADARFAAINADNILFHLASVLPAAQVNPHHGSLFLFNSLPQLNRFIADNADRYHIWPSAWRFAMREYNYHHVFGLFHEHFLKHGSLPQLACRPFLAEWARSFYRQHLNRDIPVTVQVRRNLTMATNRNLRLEFWLEFFRHCEGTYPVKFVVICARNELDDRLRDCPNVVIAKDHGTTIEQDLALIQTSAIHMGASSGPGTMAFFNSKPYFFVNEKSQTLMKHEGMKQADGFLQFSFATPYQRFAEVPESTELLVTEFARMWSSLNLADWQREDRTEPAKAFYSWMR